MHKIPDNTHICKPEMNTAYIIGIGQFKWNGILQHSMLYIQHQWAYGEVTTSGR
jgi:hypothetical protein